MNATPNRFDDQYSDREIRYMLEELSLKQKINVYYMLLYLQWSEGVANEDATPSMILRGAWVYHTGVLRDIYWSLENQIGKPGIAAMLGAVAYCLLIIAKALL